MFRYSSTTDSTIKAVCMRELDWESPGHELPVGRVQIGLVDALGNTHIVEKPNSYAFKRCYLQSNTRGTLQQL